VILIALLAAALFVRCLAVSRFLWLGAAGVVAVLLASPWLLWNLATFGSPVQSSGTALSTFARLTWSANSPGESPLPSQAAYAASNLNTALLYAGFSLITLIVVIALLVPAILARRNPARRRLTPQEEGWLVIAIVYAFAYIGFHVFVRWFMRDWYLGSVLTVLHVGIAVLAALLLRASRPFLARMHGVVRHTASLALLGAVFLNGWLFVLGDSVFGFWDAPLKYPQQGQFAGAGQWIREQLSEDTRVGSFNAGILSYSLPQPIINLDGVVNTAVQPFVQERTLLCYVAQADLDYLADFNRSFAGWGHLLTQGDPPTGWSTPVYVSDIADFPYMILEVNKALVREATGCRPADPAP
jgi:hypothetical protein